MMDLNKVIQFGILWTPVTQAYVLPEQVLIDNFTSQSMPV